jgi:hypothetical protein
MAAVLRKIWRIFAAGLTYSAQTAAMQDDVVWGDGPRPLWKKRTERT